MKNILVLVGSPRKNGNTDILVNSFILGATKAGNFVEKIYITDRAVAGCLGCNYCYESKNNKCCISDGMTEIYEKMALSDVIVFASPIYFFNVSSQLKAVIDRLHNPIRNTFKVKKLAFLAVCADSRITEFETVKSMYYAALEYFKLLDGGFVTVNGMKNFGDIKNNPALAKAELLGEQI